MSLDIFIICWFLQRVAILLIKFRQLPLFGLEGLSHPLSFPL
jgi:hypothetical protein